MFDDDGAVVSQTTTTMIVGVGVQNGILHIIGTSSADHVTVNPQGNDQVKVHANFLPNGRASRTLA